MIREITKEDLDDNYFEILTQLSGEAKPYNVYNMWETYLDGSSKTFVYTQDRVMGTASIYIESKFLHCGSKVGHIEDVVVDKNCRTKGVGKSLIMECLDYAKEQQCYKVILDCSLTNVPFYVKCGFMPDGYCMRNNLYRG